MRTDHRIEACTTPSGLGLHGLLPAIAGGVAMAAGALLPWLDVSHDLPLRRIRYVETGLSVTAGRIAFGVGLVVVAAAVALAVIPAARRAGRLAMAGGTVVVAAAVAGWSTQLVAHGEAVALGTVVSGLGVLLSLAAAGAALRERRQRAAFVAVAVGLCFVAVSVAPYLPYPVPDF